MDQRGSKREGLLPPRLTSLSSQHSCSFTKSENFQAGDQYCCGAPGSFCHILDFTGILYIFWAMLFSSFFVLTKVKKRIIENGSFIANIQADIAVVSPSQMFLSFLASSSRY